jgi:porin
MFLINAQGGTEEASSSNPYSGELGYRSTLTGDWGGARNCLSNKGVIFDLTLTQVFQGILGGGKTHPANWGSRGDLTITVDTQKLGLWPGGFLTLEAEGNVSTESHFFDSVNGQTGALMPVNSNQLYPKANGNNLNMSAWNVAQFLSPYAGLVLGKLDTTSGDMNEFAHGKGDYQFFNLALNFNPVFLLIVPNSTLGGGVIVLPT